MQWSDDLPQFVNLFLRDLQKTFDCILENRCCLLHPLVTLMLDHLSLVQLVDDLIFDLEHELNLLRDLAFLDFKLIAECL